MYLYVTKQRDIKNKVMKSNDKFQELQDNVTNQIIDLLEAGTVVWHQPWTSYGLPCNAFTQRHYEGFNAFYLHLVTMNKRYSTPYFMTYKQAAEKGGNVKKGEKGYSVVFWKISDRKTGTKTDQATGEEKDILKKTFTPFLWHVFNIDQIENIEFDLPETTQTNNEIISGCQALIDDMPQRPTICFGGNQAYYMPLKDVVQMPNLKDFENSEAFYATFFHELTHSTGHASRLDRFKEQESPARFGNNEYSKEELTAEFGASFLCAQTGLINHTIHSSAAYIKGWLEALKNDRTLIYTAASKGGKAAGFIINHTQGEEPNEENSTATTEKRIYKRVA